MGEISKDQQETSPFRGQELYILLSDRCNFSCAHCLNDSGPNAKRWSPTEGSIQSLAREINQNKNVLQLHFSGGEPTLFLPQIRQILSLVARKLKIAMTTNGWFVDRSLQYLDDLPLDSIIFSFDRFHEPFMTLERLIPLMEHMKSRNINVSVNFVFSEIEELANLAPIQARGIPVNTSRLIRSGRVKDVPVWRDHNASKQTCPSFVPEQRRTSDLEKTIYLSQKGYTPCCGPLAFDELLPEEDLYSKTLSDYSELPLRKDLLSGSFDLQAKRLGLDLGSIAFQSPCDACALLHGAVKKGLPSIAKIAANSAETQYFPMTTDLSPDQEELLLQKFVVGYTEILPSNSLKKIASETSNQPNSITLHPFTQEEHAHVVAFVEKNYYKNYSDHYSDRAIEEFTSFAPTYFGWPTVRGWVYRKNNKIVAAIFTNKYEPHPALKEPTLHIGYWGYDRDSVNKEEARFIKNHWFKSLFEWSAGLPIDASFDSFNQAALRLSRSIGFERKMLRLNRKPQ
jgi:hypothetical protein